MARGERTGTRRNEQASPSASTFMFTRTPEVINNPVRCRTRSLAHGKTWLIARNLPDIAACSFPSRYPSLGCPFHYPAPFPLAHQSSYCPPVMYTMTHPAVFRRPFIILRLISSTWAPLTRRLSSFCRTYLYVPQERLYRFRVSALQSRGKILPFASPYAPFCRSSVPAKSCRIKLMRLDSLPVSRKNRTTYLSMLTYYSSTPERRESFEHRLSEMRYIKQSDNNFSEPQTRI